MAPCTARAGVLLLLSSCMVEGSSVASEAASNEDDTSLLALGRFKPKPAGCGDKDEGLGFGGFTDNLAHYQLHATQFIGFNPKRGLGSGFVHTAEIWKSANDFNFMSPPFGNRNDLCTCDCKASDDGVGCTGYGGITLRYVSMLANVSGAWSGQMVALECGAARCNSSDPEDQQIDIIGEDRREFPGGAAIYSLATTVSMSQQRIGGVFRQSNEAVSCKAGLQDKSDYEDGKKDGNASCFYKCGDGKMYKEWLEYCEGMEKEYKFSGKGV